MSQAKSPVPAGGDEDQGPAVETVTWVFTLIALVTVVLRLFTRIRLTRNPGWDNFWVGLAMVFNLTYTILIVIAVNAGNGRHLYYLNPQQVVNASKWNFIAFIPGLMAFSIAKLCVAILLMRLLNPDRVQRTIMYFLSITCIIGSCLCAIFFFQQCSPMKSLWDASVKGKCWKVSVAIDFDIFVGAFSAFTDVYLATYPLTVVYRLKISVQKKVGLSAVLCLGLVAASIAIYKCTRLSGLYNHSDYTWSTVDLLIWTSIESSFIIIAADLPTLRPVYQLVLGRITNSRDSSGAQRRSSYKLNPAPLGPSSRQRRIPKDQYLTDTIDLVGKKSEDQERILPPGRIRRTLDVSVNHHSEEDDQLGGLQCSTHHFDVERGTQYR